MVFNVKAERTWTGDEGHDVGSLVAGPVDVTDAPEPTNPDARWRSHATAGPAGPLYESGVYVGLRIYYTNPVVSIMIMHGRDRWYSV